MTDRALLRSWAGVVIISFSGVFVRLADVEAARSAFLRGAYALPAFALLLLVTRRRAGRDLKGTLVPLALVAGALLGADLLAWHEAIGIIGAGLATVLPNLQVLVVGVAGIVLFGERPRGGFWLAVPVVLAGVWLIGATGKPVEPDGRFLVGVAYGLLTAVFYSGYLIVLRMARLRSPAAGALEIMGSATLGATAVMGTWAALHGVAAPPASLEANLWLAALALGSQVVGWILLTTSIHRLPAALTSVVLLLQPVLAMIWGAALLGEPIGWVQAVGAAVVIAGVGAAHRALTARPARRTAAPTHR